jgi:malate synthase
MRHGGSQFSTEGGSSRLIAEKQVREIKAHANCAPAGASERGDAKEFLNFFRPLHREFTPRQQFLASERKRVLANSQHGEKPVHLFPSGITKGNWSIEIPDWCQDQRNQMTGPADDAELVVKMLNSGAPGVMLDLEDSVVNRWDRQQIGIENILLALHGVISYYDRKREKLINVVPSSTIIWIRPRGLHISQAGVSDDINLTSASLFDLASIVFRLYPAKLKRPLCIYIPKSESAEEALWWRDVFKTLASWLGMPNNYIKCMALVESHPIAFQMEEFLFNLRDHIVGLNLGRWDYMASLIHFNLQDPGWVLPDRNSIPHDVRFFQNLRELIVEICHKRGALAIGGMTALYPSREDRELNDRALAVLAKDKKNEAACHMDGAWTGHPDQNEIAIAQFPSPNQIQMRRKGAERYCNLRPEPSSVGQRTLAGTRAAIRTVIQYRNGVLNGRGASLVDGYMEDLATDRIYRLMIAQRMVHSHRVPIMDESRSPVIHSRELITRLFNEELDNLISSRPQTTTESAETLREARVISEALIHNDEFDHV